MSNVKEERIRAARNALATLKVMEDAVESCEGEDWEIGGAIMSYFMLTQVLDIIFGKMEGIVREGRDPIVTGKIIAILENDRKLVETYSDYLLNYILLFISNNYGYDLEIDADLLNEIYPTLKDAFGTFVNGLRRRIEKDLSEVNEGGERGEIDYFI
jgi:hypothetical protein